MAASAINWLFAAGVIQAVFLGCSLLTLKIRNRPAVQALAGLMALLAVMLTERFAENAGSRIVLGLGLALEFGFAPLLYLFTRAVAEPTPAFRRGTIWHIAPMTAALFALALMHVSNTGGSLGIDHPQFGPAIVAWVFAKLAYFCAYAILIIRVMRRSIASASSGRVAAMRWLGVWISMIFAAVGASYLSFILFLAGAPIRADADVYAGFALFAVTFLIAYFVLANQRLLDHMPRPTSAAAPADIKNAELIVDFFRSRKPQLDADFGIDQLARALGLTPPSIQTALQSGLGCGFQEFLNRRRLEEFEALAVDRSNADKTTLELAFSSGFNSKATFYRTFRAAKGTTPRTWRENLSLD